MNVFEYRVRIAVVSAVVAILSIWTRQATAASHMKDIEKTDAATDDSLPLRR